VTTTWKITEGDIVRSNTNTGYTLVSDTPKVKQDVSMVLTTDVRDSTNLGCGLDEVIGSDNDNPASMYGTSPAAFEFQTKVRAGLNRLKAAQKQAQFSQRTAKELIHDIGPVQMWPVDSDSRNFLWRVDIMTVDGRSSFTANGSTRG